MITRGKKSQEITRERDLKNNEWKVIFKKNNEKEVSRNTKMKKT